MNKPRIYIGADVSKLTIDFTLLTDGQAFHKVVANKEVAIKKYLKELKATFNVEEEQLFIGIENTGRYSWPGLKALTATRVHLYLLSPLHLKKSMGMIRGKSDLIDSERIARFMSKNTDELKAYNPPREVIEQISLLLSRRNKLQRLVKAESSTKEDMSCMGKSTIKTFILAESQKTVVVLKKQILRVEDQIELLIKSDAALTHKVKLMMSVPGVGKVLSWYMIVKTNEFKNFDDPRKLACFAGVAPFEHSSGTSVRGKTRVSFYADKMLKKILHLSALRVIQIDGELRQFYLRKVEKGKNKMSIINALRNKIIHRIMAVIRENRPYELNY